MKIHVLYDDSGQILAAAELSESASKDSLQVRPVAKPGQYSADMDVPAALAHLSFKDACEKLTIDVAQKVLRLRAQT